MITKPDSLDDLFFFHDFLLVRSINVEPVLLLLLLLLLLLVFLFSFSLCLAL